MEKQKIFWVVLSVSILVVIVLITGVFLLRQKPASAIASTPGTINPISEPGTQIYEYQKELPAGGAQPSGAQGGQQTQHFYIGEGEQPAASAPGATTQGAQPSAPQPSGQVGAQPAPQQSVSPPAPVQAKPAAPPASAVRKPAVTRPSAPKPAPSQRVVEYWIQTGSYKSQSKAEELSATLGDKGLSARVFSFTSRGDTFYRVRIGPYASSGEARKFLAIVKRVQGLESSFVSQVRARRTLN